MLAETLREAFAGRAEVLSPDLPLHPQEAIALIRNVIDREHPDLLVGNSCGAFYAQMLTPIVGIPALLGNPYFRMTEFLKPRLGVHEYKSQRADGQQGFIIDEALVSEFAKLEADPTVSDDEVRAFGTGSMRKAVFDGDLAGGSFLAGEVAGLVTRRESAADIVNDIIGGAERLLASAPGLLN